MTEGELKKQIKQSIRDQHTESVWTDDDEIYFEVIEIAEGQLNSILDDAKKEWLLIEDFRYNELGKGYISQEQARQDWFKKWFGSE